MSAPLCAATGCQGGLSPLIFLTRTPGRGLAAWGQRQPSATPLVRSTVRVWFAEMEDFSHPEPEGLHRLQTDCPDHPMATEGQGTKPSSHQSPKSCFSLLLGLTAPCINGMQESCPGSSDPGDGGHGGCPCTDPIGLGSWGDRLGVTPYLAPEKHEGCPT